MRRAICFVIDTPIVQSYKSFYLFDALNESGYQLSLIDASPFLNPDAYERVQTGLIDYEQYHVHLCKNYKEVFEVLDVLENDTLVFDTAGWIVEHYPLYKYLRKRNMKYGYMMLNSCYEVANQAQGISRFKEYFRCFSWKRLKNTIFVRLPRKLFPNLACSFVIMNSPSEIENYKRRFYCDDKTQFLIVHSYMYEEALEHQNEMRLVQNKYCVWLDSYIPYHPDLKNIGFHVDAERYYLSLRKFFSWIQETYNVEVVVSAHPRSDYVTHSDAYEGFKVIKNETCLLVRDAEFVMAAASTSFLYVITYNKPVFFIYQDVLAESLPSHIRLMEMYARELGKKPINIDEFDYTNRLVFDEQLIVNENLYKKSAEKYTKQNYDGCVEGDSYKKTIIDFLESL